MDTIQQVLMITLYAVFISFFGLIIYCEIANIYLKMTLQVSIDWHQEQLDLCPSKEISHEPIILPLVIEEKSIEIDEPKMLTLIKKKKLDLTSMNVTELRFECGKRRIKWREAVTDIKTGKKRCLRKAEMMAALQQKLSA